MRKIYDINWNSMDISNQKIFQIVLLKANQDVQFTYIFGALDFESFVSVKA